jgi:hypothetical protein
VSAKDNGKFIVGIRAKNVAVEVNAIGHPDFHVSIDDDVIFSL